MKEREESPSKASWDMVYRVLAGANGAIWALDPAIAAMLEVRQEGEDESQALGTVLILQKTPASRFSAMGRAVMPVVAELPGSKGAFLTSVYTAHWQHFCITRFTSGQPTAHTTFEL